MNDVTLRQVWLAAYTTALAALMHILEGEQPVHIAVRARIHADEAVAVFKDAFHWGEDD